jgi:hypothetical protein
MTDAIRCWGKCIRAVRRRSLPRWLRGGVHLMNTRNGYTYYAGSRTKSWKRFLPSAYGESAVVRQRKLLVTESYEELIAELREQLPRQSPLSPSSAGGQVK